MCGIAGIFDCNHKLRASELEENARRMGATLAHRGPDGQGSWANTSAGVSLAHRRLAILDLSPAAAQPMKSPSGRYVIAYNGEVYNHGELRRELESMDPALRFRGYSDTEVMLAAIERWGVEDALRRFRGMFAFALWDAEERALYLARDRFGEKPLYYGWTGGVLLFASELKAICAYEDFAGELNREALALFFRFSAIPAPHSIYRGIFKLPPASWIRISAAQQQATPNSYWSLLQAAQQGVADPLQCAEREAIEQLESLLRSAVAEQMIADVPLGAFLSGGIDSSNVVALMQRRNSHVKTFSIGVRDSSYNEAESAKRVAAHLGTEHTELYVESAEAMGVIPRLASIYDEPFADSSQIPELLLAELTRRHVTVALSGDGGDEVFGGYNRYVWVQRIWKTIGWTPAPARRMLGSLARMLPARSANAVFRIFNPILPASLRHELPGDKLHKLSPLLGSADAREFYRHLASQWQQPALLVPDVSEPVHPLFEPHGFQDFVAEMMYLDSISFLPDDVLTKVDRATMAGGLESRAPFLDVRVAEFAWRLPSRMKIRAGQGKWILRELLSRSVPRALWQRPKMGFGIPLDSWLRGEMRDWAEELLSEKRLRESGLLQPAPVRAKWREHLSGRRDWQYQLWDVLMFQSWLEASRARASVPAAVGAPV